MTDEELEDWGLAYVENLDSLEDLNDPSLTQQQRDWLEDFFAEV